MMQHLRRLGLLLLLPAFLSGCTAISSLSQASQPLEIYELDTPQTARSRVSRNAELVVAEPVGTGSVNTERILIQPSPLQAQYLPGVRWADTAPVMLQTVLVRSLIETGAFTSVGRSPIGSLSDFTLLSELTDFQAEVASEGTLAVVRVRIVFRLVRESDSRVIATSAFAVTEQADATDIDSVVAAFNRATARVTTGAVPWVIGATSGPV